MAVSVTYFAIMLNMTLRLTKEQFKEAGYLHMYSSYAMGIAAACLLEWNLLMGATPGFYIAACMLNLFVALIGFITFSVQKILYW